MPMSRWRGGTMTPSAGEDTSRPPMLIDPAVGCSSPATQRRVVVLPQPDGPSSTTISPAGITKLTPSTAGRPATNAFTRSRTSSVAAIRLFVPRYPCRMGRGRRPKPIDCMMGFAALNPSYESLSIVICLVPVLDPVLVQLHVLLEVRHPELHLLGIESLRIERHLLERGEVALLFDHEGLAFERHAPVEEKLCGVRMGGRLRDPACIRVHRGAFRREDHLDRRAVALLGEDRVVEQRAHG